MLKIFVLVAFSSSCCLEVEVKPKLNKQNFSLVRTSYTVLYERIASNIGQKPESPGLTLDFLLGLWEMFLSCPFICGLIQLLWTLVSLKGLRIFGRKQPLVYTGFLSLSPLPLASHPTHFVLPLNLPLWLFEWMVLFLFSSCSWVIKVRCSFEIPYLCDLLTK